MLGTLAASYAEIVRFDEAVKYQKQALALGGIRDQDRSEAEHQLSLYESKQPYRQEVKP
jgi:hypothetical protein